MEIVTVPCLKDNYAYLLRGDGEAKASLVDAPEAGPIIGALEARGWGLDAILITHHHGDHIDGVAALREKYGARIVGAAADRSRLPPLDLEVAEGNKVRAGGAEAVVIDARGHTIGHIAYHFPQAKALFCADSLMVMGCGRLFEGTAADMWETLHKFSQLPDDTLIYSGHEYAEANLRFALSVDPENADLRERARAIADQRASARPTVPAPLGLERRTNPFLRASDPGLRAAIGAGFEWDIDVFAELRRRKDSF